MRSRHFNPFDDTWRNVRHAGRLLARHPLFTFTAAVSLAIGIGATTTMFTVADALLLRAAPGLAQPERLVDVGTSRAMRRFGPTSYLNYLDLRARATSLEGAYAYSRFPQSMTLGGEAGAATENIFASVVTSNYFSVLGAVPGAGRLLAPADGDQPGTTPFVVLSDRLWRRRFDGDPAVVGRTVAVNGHPLTIIGITAPGFRGTGMRAIDAWVPIAMMPALIPRGAATLSARGTDSLLVGARLKPGASLQQAAAELNVIGEALAREEPETNPTLRFVATGLSAVPGNSGPVVAAVAALFVIVSLVLIVACANVAGVLLARAGTRRREMALRLAIGASRARLVRQLLTETSLLFALGGTAGLLLARVLTALVASLLPALPFPVDLSLPLDVRVVAFTAGVSFVSALLCGLAPALQASKTDVLPGLKNDAALIGRMRLRHVFVVGQVAFSILLIVCAGLFVRALQRAASIDPGFQPRAVELASIDLAQAGYTERTGLAFVRELIPRVLRLPGVSNATIASNVPGGFEVRREELEVTGAAAAGRRALAVDWTIVEPAYFATLQTPITAGREFTAADRDGAQPVAIVSEAAARQFWPGETALGRYLSQRVAATPARTPSTRSLLVVGVARDVQSTSLIDGLSRPGVYVPLAQQYVSAVTIVARTDGRRAADGIRTLLRSMNPALAIATSQTLEDSVALGLVPQRIAASVSGMLGLVGLLLAVLGVYGVTAAAVAQRTREIGIRIAVGARPQDVVRMVLREGLSLTAIGSGIGLILAAAASQVLAGFLFGIAPIDPITFAGTALLFAAAGVAACYGPVRRAARIDPVQSLRCE